MDYEKASEKLQEAVEKFEEQYDVELRDTGNELTENQKDRDEGTEEVTRIEREYFVDGLVESPVLSLEVGGWFTISTTGNEVVRCNLAIKIDDKPIPDENHTLRGWFENGKWKNLKLRPL